MTSWDQLTPKLVAVLESHFPSADAAMTADLATAIYDGFRASGSLQWIERFNAPPLDDVEKIKKAAHQLKKAAGELRKVGWHGGHALSSIAAEISRQKQSSLGVPLMSAEAAIDALAEFIAGLSEALQLSSGKIDRNAESVLVAFGDPSPAGRPAGAPCMTQAYFVARECCKAFQAATGKPPTLVVDRYSGKAGGPFLCFLADVFLVFGIEANAEHFARTACKELIPK